MTTSNSPMTPITTDVNAGPLAQLQDIKLPDPISAMPIAPGYWIIAALVIILLAWLSYKLYKKYQHHAPRKMALAMLNQYDINDDDFAANVNSLLKRTAMTYLPRQHLAKLNGQPWFDWLDKRLPSKHQQQIGELLIKRHQPSGLSLDDKQQLLLLARAWLTSTQAFSDQTLITNQAQEA
ncbi:DUF4381 domain-containing protein [Shewanella sp.]|uniref:DUF4381 domain-containing protein n=1 Tax=Shewanella sp. TaxID=50422 RepID=UPI0035678084